MDPFPLLAPSSNSPLELPSKITEVIVSGDIRKPAVIIEGAVTVYWIDFNISASDSCTESTIVEVKIAVTNQEPANDVPLTTYVGRAFFSDDVGNPQYVFIDGIIYSINAALFDLVENFVGD